MNNNKNIFAETLEMTVGEECGDYGKRILADTMSVRLEERKLVSC